MRIFVFILSFIMLGLAVMPCSDSMTCSEEKAHTSQATENHSHSDDDGDLCPPFCICSCCGVASYVAITAITLDFSYTIVYKEKKQSDYKSEYTSSYLNTIWQPPRV